ncbi:hypothetical protein [Erysipelothrix aquatica]|uniref:hypothetical protein n=1 Tax=Erysipelothrix aquatica TaxID=2683714 RepID=UPI00135A836C|nr:hypothetical protein [Erysipelothrix aquatica]
MKLKLDKKYVGELQATYGTPGVSSNVVYAIQQKAFAITPSPKIILLEPSVVIIISLNAFSLKVASVETYRLDGNTTLIAKRGILYYKLKIKVNGKKVFKANVLKNVMGLNDIQKPGVQALLKY